MGFIRHILCALAFFTLANKAFAASPERVCDDIEHCIYILERHAPDSFDYKVLHSEFLSFGPKATDALVEVAAWMDDPKSSYAFQMLSKGGFRFTPAQQRDLIEVWPRENVRAHALVLGRIASPRVRAAAIDTLENVDPEIRQQSRYLLSRVAKGNFKFPMRQEDYGKLVSAVLREPHPALIAMLQRYPTKELRPALARLLRSGDPDTTMAVYGKLYQTDKVDALKTLVGVIQDLEENELAAAIAISKMLQRRNASRPDGFYYTFSKDLTEDKNLGLAGRAVGYDVLINANFAKQKNTSQIPKLPDTALNRNVFKYVVAGGQQSDAYVAYLDRLTSETANPYILAFAPTLKDGPNPKFISKLGRFRTTLAKDVTARALSHPSDYQMIAAGMIAAAKQKQTRLKAKITGLKSNHPITAIRVAARITLREFSQPNVKKSAEQHMQSLRKSVSRAAYEVENKGQPYCNVRGVDFRNLSRKMPYFKPSGDNPDIYSERQNLTTSAELKSGWLAGYDVGKSGGNLLYYDYDIKAAVKLLDENILAIIPTRAVPLGRYPTSFWVITGASYAGVERGGIYRVTQRGNEFDVKLHAALPEPARRIAVNKDNSIAMDFVDRAVIRRLSGQKTALYMFNPPLLLDAKGAIRRFCKPAAARRADSTP